MYHFFVGPEAVENGTISISGSDYNHIKNVLRLDKNEEVSFYDGE